MNSGGRGWHREPRRVMFCLSWASLLEWSVHMTNALKVGALVVLVALIIVIVALTVKDRPSPNPASTVASDTSTPPATPQKSVTPNPRQSPFPSQPSAGVPANDNAPSVLASVDAAKASGPIPKAPDRAEGAVLVTVDRDRISHAQVDENLTVVIPQSNQKYVIKVDSIRRLSGGELVVGGKIVSPSGMGHAMFTLSSRATFGSLNSTQGSYSLRGNTAYSWLIPRSSLSPGSKPPGQDYVIQQRTQPPMPERDKAKL